MSYSDLSLPIDIPWKRIAASSDMIDSQYGDRKFPPKWRSSVSVFYHEPNDLVDTYCDRKVTYLKVACSITGYQPGREVGISTPPIDDRWEEEVTKLGERYLPCLGAILQVAVFPPNMDKEVSLADFPYIMDFEPKKRELYEAVTLSGEVLSRSNSTVNLRKGATTTDTTEDASKNASSLSVGAVVPIPGIPIRVGGDFTSERTRRDISTSEKVDIKTTDDSREKRETFSHSTSLNQMYELFNGYHLGTNRAVFYMVPRPRIVDRTDEYTFINGPRKLEGIQEVFLVINRPKDLNGICVEAYLETAHIVEAAKPPPDPGTGSQPTTTTASIPFQLIKPASDIRGPGRITPGRWTAPGVGSKVLTVEHLTGDASWEVDVNRPDGGFTVTQKIGTGIIDFKVTSTADAVKLDGVVEAELVCDSFKCTGTDGVLNAIVVVYLRRKAAGPGTPGSPPASPVDKNLILTGRGINTCVLLTEKETASPFNVYTGLDWTKINPQNIPASIDRALFDPAEIRDDKKFKNKVKILIEKKKINPVPEEWLLPSEWITHETKIPVNPLIENPSIPANDRVRLSNDLSDRLGRTMVESLGSRKRYRNQTLSFGDTKVAVDYLTESFAISMADDDPLNVRISDLDVPFKHAILSRFGKKIRMKDFLMIPTDELKIGLSIRNDKAAKKLKPLLLSKAKKYSLSKAKK